MNVKVTGMMIPRSSRRGALGFPHIPCLHDDLPNTGHETQQHNNRVGALIWSHPKDQITPVGPGRTSTIHGCLVRQRGCGWPDFTTDDKRQNETTAQTQDDSNTGVGSDKL